MYSFSDILSFLLCIFVVLHASILVFRGSNTNNPLKAAGKMCNITIAHLLRNFIHLIPAVIQQFHGSAHTNSGDVCRHRVIRLPLECMTQMSFTDPQVLCDLCHTQFRIPIMSGNIVYGCHDIFALVAFI